MEQSFGKLIQQKDVTYSDDYFLTYPGHQNIISLVRFLKGLGFRSVESIHSQFDDKFTYTRICVLEDKNTIKNPRLEEGKSTFNQLHSKNPDTLFTFETIQPKIYKVYSADDRYDMYKFFDWLGLVKNTNERFDNESIKSIKPIESKESKESEESKESKEEVIDPILDEEEEEWKQQQNKTKKFPIPTDSTTTDYNYHYFVQ